MARRPRSSASIGRLEAPRENAPRGTFRVSQALRELAMRNPSLMTRSAVNQAQKAAQTPVRVAAASTAKVAVDERRAPDPKERRAPEPDVRKREDPRVCKSRPSSNRGSGNGRPFVPWCK